MGVTRKDKILVDTLCDLCAASMGTSLIDPGEYGDWLKHTTDLLTFTITAADPLLLNYPTTRNALLCWECIRARGLVKEYDKRLNDLTYPKDKAQ